MEVHHTDDKRQEPKPNCCKRLNRRADIETKTRDCEASQSERANQKHFQPKKYFSVRTMLISNNQLEREETINILIYIDPSILYISSN
jgi:hypothetical protein